MYLIRFYDLWKGHDDPYAVVLHNLLSYVMSESSSRHEEQHGVLAVLVTWTATGDRVKMMDHTEDHGPMRCSSISSYHIGWSLAFFS